MANLSFVPAQRLRKFVPVGREVTSNPVVKDGEDVSDMM